MKRILAVCLVIAAMPVAAQAKDVWAGDAYIYQASPASDCGSFSYMDDHFYARYLPKTTANGNQSLLTWFELNNWALAFKLKGGEFDGTLRPVDVNGIWLQAYGFPSTSRYAPKVKFESVIRSPSATTTTSSTTFLNITGEIQNFDGFPACTLSFRMSLGKVARQ